MRFALYDGYMPTVLFLQFRSDIRVRDHEQKCVEKLLKGKCNLRWCNAIFDELPETNDVDALILGGSALYLSSDNEEDTDKNKQLLEDTLRRTVPLVEDSISRGLPILGICFGHQLISFVLGQEIIVDKHGGKRGTHHIMLTEEGKHDPLFKGLPNQFYVQYFHREVVGGLPDEAVLLAHGTHCPVSVFRYRDSIYGTQFHPELDIDIMHERARIRDEEEFLPLVKPAPEARKILFNFVEHIVPNNTP